MRESLYKSYSMRGTELALLLASRKEKSVHCLGIISGEETREQYMYSVERMVKQGIAQAEGDRIVINEPYRTMIDAIVSAKSVVTVRTSDDEMNDYCLYKSGDDRVLALSMSSVRRHGVLLTELSFSELFEVYLPAELLPCDTGDMPPPEETDISVFEPIFKMLRNDRSIDDVRFIIGADAVNTVTLRRRSMIVMEMPMGIYSVYSDENGIRAEAYERARFISELKRLISGEVFEDDNGDDPFRNA